MSCYFFKLYSGNISDAVMPSKLQLIYHLHIRNKHCVSKYLAVGKFSLQGLTFAQLQREYNITLFTNNLTLFKNTRARMNLTDEVMWQLGRADA